MLFEVKDEMLNKLAVVQTLDQYIRCQSIRYIALSSQMTSGNAP